MAPAQPQFVRTAAGRFGYLCAGAQDAPLVLCLHGFPDHPRSFVPLLDALAAAGYFAVAPWMRGYAPSPLAGPFHVDQLAVDALALADAFSPGRPAAIIGHDWGAAATYVALAEAPTRWWGGVTMAVPHPMTFIRALAAPAQLRRSWYIGLFQLPVVAERALAAGDWGLVRALWRSWSPGYTPDPTAMQRLIATLAASMPAPIDYYRAMTRPPGQALRRMLGGGARRVAVPTLHLQGADDGCIAPSACAGQAAYFDAPFDSRIVAGAGHFLVNERPEAIARAATDWLAAHTGGAKSGVSCSPPAVPRAHPIDAKLAP